MSPASLRPTEMLEWQFDDRLVLLHDRLKSSPVHRHGVLSLPPPTYLHSDPLGPASPPRACTPRTELLWGGCREDPTPPDPTRPDSISGPPPLSRLMAPLWLTPSTSSQPHGPTPPSSPESWRLRLRTMEVGV